MKAVKLYIVMIIFILGSLKGNTNNIKHDTIKSLSSTIILEIPDSLRYKKMTQVYSEGIFYILNFHNQSYIMIIDGGLLKLETDSIMCLNQNFKLNGCSFIGNKDNKYYRKDIISEIILYYGNVSCEYKPIFDSIFDNIIIYPYYLDIE